MARHDIRDDKGRFAKRPGGGALLAVVLATAIGAGGTAGVAGTAGGAGAGGTSASASSARTGSQARRQDANAARARLLRQALRVEHHFDSTDDCVAHSYGQVREFLREQPCVFAANSREHIGG